MEMMSNWNLKRSEPTAQQMADDRVYGVRQRPMTEALRDN